MSLLNLAEGNAAEWKNTEKIIFRFIFLYFIIQVVPLDWKFYRELFSINLQEISFYDLFALTRYAPQFFSLDGFTNWLIAALVALAGTIAWSYKEPRNVNYSTLYYWLRVILRYRLAFAVIAYGLIKLFPLQMPYPSLSNLHTNYGEFLPWKIYFHTIGIVQPYEAFLGSVEIAAGILLLFRKTTTIGAGIIIGFLGNIFAANIAYDAGEQVYSTYLLVIALFLFAYDAPRLYRLLVLGQFTKANRFKPDFKRSKIKTFRTVLKSASALFIILLSIATYANFIREPYKIPRTPGLPDASGFYNVREFRFNNKEIPYSTTDTNRWQNVIFEKWATISIKSAKPVIPDLSRGDEYHKDDLLRNFESAGVGERRYFAYNTDQDNSTLFLQNKNKNHSDETFALNFSRPNDSTIIVQGVNEKNDAIYAVLEKITRKYMLYEGRRKRVKL